MTTEEFLAEWRSSAPHVLVHTSGSTGRPKAMLAEKRRMEASARITCQFLGLQAGDTALLCLPQDYIAGKMMVVRSLLWHLRLLDVGPTGHPLASPLLPEGVAIDFAAMIPLQVYNALQVPAECERLMRIRHLIIGGGAVDDDLAARLADFPHAVWSTYGMTETLSHIALRRLSGPTRSEWYTPFEGVSVALNDEGCLVITAPAVCAEPLVTNDVAELETSGDGALAAACRFRILGRRDNVVCSGGIKIQMEEVERLLRAHVRVPFLISRAPDPLLGQQVVMLTEGTDVASLRAICRQVLPKYWQPRRIVHVARLPLTETGKPARAAAERLAQQL